MLLRCIIRRSRCGVLVRCFAAAYLIGGFDSRRHLSFVVLRCVVERCCVCDVCVICDISLVTLVSHHRMRCVWFVLCVVCYVVTITYHWCVIKHHSLLMFYLLHWCMRWCMLLLLGQSTLGLALSVMGLGLLFASCVRCGTRRCLRHINLL